MGFTMVLITFPVGRERDLLDEMKNRATTPWTYSEVDTHGRPTEDGKFYFLRDETETEPSGILCIYRDKHSHLHIHNVLADERVPINEPLPEKMVYRFVKEFFNKIAGPSADAIEGDAYLRFGVCEMDS